MPSHLQSPYKCHGPLSEVVLQGQAQRRVVGGAGHDRELAQGRNRSLEHREGRLRRLTEVVAGALVMMMNGLA